MADPALAPDQKARIVRNIRAVCILYIVLGSVIGLGSASLLRGSEDIPPAAAVGLLVGGAAAVVAGVAVLRRKRWGVPLCRVVSVLYLLNFPIGTILGGYILVNIGKVKDEFR